MEHLSKYIQSADWKSEKHVPVIEAPDAVTAGEMFDVKVSIGKEVSHPNTTEHHIAWISLYFYPEGSKFPFEIGNFEFSAHGASVDGPNTGPCYAHHQIVATMKTDKPGVLHAVSYCNIHGLWENSRQVGLR